MKFVKKALPHITVVLGLMTLTFFGIDRVNTGMAFMTSELSKWVFAALAVFAIAVSVLLMGYLWRDEARAARREQKRAARRRPDAEPPETAEGVWDSEEDA